MGFRRSNLGFLCMDGLFWATYCTVFGFVVTILLEYGFSSEICGLITTLQCVVIMLVQPFYGFLVDRIISPKWGFIGIMVLGTLFAVPLPWIFRMDSWVVIVYITFLSLFTYSGGAVADTWAVSVINCTKGMDYALVRGGGSVFYAVVALVAGWLIAPLGVETLFILHVMLGIITVVFSIFLVDSDKIKDHQIAASQPKQRIGFFKAAKVLLSNHDYLIFTICVCLYNLGNRPYATYFPMVLENIGGGSDYYGLALFIAAAGEMLFMVMASRLVTRGIPLHYLYITALCTMTIRYFMMSVIGSLWLMMVTQILQAMGNGLVLRVSVEYLVNTAPPGYAGMAIMVSASIGNGVGCVLGNLMGGILIDKWGVHYYVLFSACMFAIAVAVYAPTVYREYKHRRQLRLEHLWHLHMKAVKEAENGE